MLEWTGERFLPWLKESTIAYEHLHRYAYAAALLKGQKVLDLACGEGYGSKMLADAASHVVAIDIDADVVRHASQKYGSNKLQFLTGSITAVPVPDDHSFDAVVCFEAVEHIENQDALLAEVKRLLRPEGILILSTPNKVLYDQQSHEENPFHVKELDFVEFQQLLARYFLNSVFLGQRIHPGSSIWPVGVAGASGLQEFVVERNDSQFEFASADKRIPLYFIAIASDAAIDQPPSSSILVDQSDSLFKEKDQQLQASIEETRWREQQLQDREATIQSLEQAAEWHEAQIRDLAESREAFEKGLAWMRNRADGLEQTVRFHESTIASQQNTISSHEQALVWRAGQVSELERAKEYWERESASMTAQLQNTQRQLRIASDTLAGIYKSRGWKFIMKLRSIRDAFKGRVKSRG